MKVSKSTSSNNLIGRDFSSSTQAVTNTRSGKFGSSSRTYHVSTTIGKSGEVLNHRSIDSSSASLELTSGIIGSTIGLLFGLVLLINIFGVFQGYTEFRGVEWVLDVLSKAPSIPTDWLNTWSSFKITADWGVFSFLADFINLFSDVLETVVFLATGVINILMFILYFIKAFLFVGV